MGIAHTASNSYYFKFQEKKRKMIMQILGGKVYYENVKVEINMISKDRWMRKKMGSDVINMSRAQDKEKIWVLDRNWTNDLLYTGQML